MSMTNLLFLWMYIYSCCFPFLHIKEKSTWAIKYDTRSYDVSVIYVSARKSLSYRYKNTARTKDFKDCTDFLNSVEFICLYLFYVVVLLRGTNEITLVFRRIETFIGDEKTLSQVRNRLNREIWFCKDFTPAGVTILKWNLTRYLIIRSNYDWKIVVVKMKCFARNLYYLCCIHWNHHWSSLLLYNFRTNVRTNYDI